MKRTQIFCYFEWVLYTTVLFSASPSSSQGEFISLDCGGNKNYTDGAGIQWIPDDTSYIQTGEALSLPGGDSRSLQLNTVRRFPENKKNCYVFKSLNNATKYLLRATFLYANYDISKTAPVFQLLLDANVWDTISFVSGEPIYKEVIVMPKLNGLINVCLGRGDSGDPFISSLELRPLLMSMYAPVNRSFALLKRDRTDFGAWVEKDSIRYPDDPYDRIWETSVIDYPNISTPWNVSQGRVPDQPPSSVMRTAEISYPNSFSYQMPRIKTKFGYFYVSIYFAELDKLNASSIREFDVYLREFDGFPNDEFLYGPLQPRYLEATNVSFLRWNAGINYTLVLRSTNRSVSPPLVNAIEIYRASELVDGTFALDVKSLEDIQEQINLQPLLNGDPCLPPGYGWEWVGCNNDTSPRVTSLHLSSKGLNGIIPSSIQFLTALVTLDLSDNNLSGSVPEFLSKLKNLTELNLENNNLTGSLPASLTNRTDGFSIRLSGNPLLCDSQQNLCAGSDGHGTRKSLIIALPLAGAIGLRILCFVGVIAWKRLNLRKNNPGSFHLRNAENGKEIGSPLCREFSYKEMRELTGDFHRQIGRGGFGPVFYGRFQNGLEAAVKVLSENSKQGAKEFSTEVVLLSRVHHRNLVSLVGYCSERDKQILVFEYMSKGNLGQLLRGSKMPENFVSWETRLNIMLDAAQGLEYLHEGCNPPIIHRDVKTSNILLSERMEAKIADFGLSRVGPSSEATHVSTNVKGTFGYLDPEYTATHNLTDKSDVYSFGVVILEVISGRPAVDTSASGDSIHIVNWARAMKRGGNIEGMVDSSVGEGIEIKLNSMCKVAELALLCTESRARERPTMSEVVMELRQAIIMLKTENVEDMGIVVCTHISNEISSVLSPR